MSKLLISLSQLNHPNPYQIQSELDELVKSTILRGLGVKSPFELKQRLPKDFRVLLKPNFVLDKPRSTTSNMDCLITHKAIIISILRFLRELEPGEIIIGDSPIQKCDFNNIITDEYMQEIRDQIETKISFTDFRRLILASPGDIRSGLVENRDDSHYVLFNLRNKSLLEPVTSIFNKFQITNYDVRELYKHHRKNFHEYLICREVFDVDLIINLPKLKMHAKAGFTGALKNFVGCIGDKMYLPHHKFGGTKIGGDCYPGWHFFKLMAELCLNKRNAVIPQVKKVTKWDRRYQFLMKADRRFSRSQEQNHNQVFEGSWFGNDTVWRTVLDIFNVIEHGDHDGIIHNDPQRMIWTLTDALICGEGQGPLNPSPRNIGLLSFSDNAYALDVFHGFLVGYKIGEVKFLDNLVRIINPEDIVFLVGNQVLTITEAVEKYKVNLIRPKHWETF